MENCINCSKPLPLTGFFCGGCLSQFKCKSCSTLLEKDNMGCTNCGSPKEEKFNQGNIASNTNTFHLHETLTERTIEASFSDVVGKDLTGILRDAYSVKAIGEAHFNKTLSDSNERYIQNAELLNFDNVDSESQDMSKTHSSSQDLPLEYPSLKAIAMKNLPNSETEWVVVYAFYASKFGEETFTRQSIIEKYSESNRLDTDKKNALSSYIRTAVRSGYLNPLQSDYSILDEGIKKAKEIISRTTGSSPKYKSSSKDKQENANSLKNAPAKKSPTGSKTLKRLSNIDFEPTGKENLSTFIGKYSPKNDKERNLLFTFYLQEILKITEITFDHIYTCYDALDLRVSENLTQTVRNTSSKTGWIELKNSIISVTVKGNNQIKSWNKQK